MTVYLVSLLQADSQGRIYSDVHDLRGLRIGARIQILPFGTQRSRRSAYMLVDSVASLFGLSDSARRAGTASIDDGPSH